MTLLPFGEPASENEASSRLLGLYYKESPFSGRAIDSDTYLIVGRRGSGKTALGRYLSFQDVIPKAIFILLDEPEAYEEVLSHVSYSPSQSRSVAIPTLAKVWEYVFWCLIFERTKSNSTIIRAACDDTCVRPTPSSFVDALIRRVHQFLESSKDGNDFGVTTLLSDEDVQKAKKAVLELAAQTPIFLVIDTLEQYDLANEGFIRAIAALVQAASKFNRNYSSSNIHLKVMMSGELFPHLEESAVQNTGKFISRPLYLYWRSKDLLRLICWRFHKHLEEKHMLSSTSSNIDWTNHADVLKKMWIPYFGDYITNGRGTKERSFYYVLRHTQMRPRQLIRICNEIAELAIKDGSFPKMQESQIRRGVLNAEGPLAKEILNSFGSIYADLTHVARSLQGLPMTFLGSELAKRAKMSKGGWTATYSHNDFFGVVAELGIVGKVRSTADTNHIVEATFEYMLDRPLGIKPSDRCAIHPMFYSRLEIAMDQDVRVIPFGYDSESED